MHKKNLLTILTLFLTTILVSCNTVNNNFINETIENEISYTNSTNTSTSTDYVSMIDFAYYLKDAEEHYPLSDEFVERYQQAGGGYIDLAKSRGIEVNRYKHSPNQKWHFYDSWLFGTLEDNGITWDANARQRVYTNLLSPELLLWIYEASGVSPEKVRDAKLVAEEGRLNGTHLSTLASLMRKVVSWEDIIANLDTSVTHATEITSLPQSIDLTAGDVNEIITPMALPSNTTDKATWSIISGDELINISTNNNDVLINALNPGVAIINVSYNDFISQDVEIIINEPAEPAIINVPSLIDLDIEGSYLLNPILNIDNSTYQFISNNEEIVKVNNEGVVIASSYGSTTITISSIEYPNITKTISIEVFNHGTIDDPLSVEDIHILKEGLNKDNNIFNTHPFFIQGLVLNNSSPHGSFTIADINDELITVEINNSIRSGETSLPSQNDEVILKGYVKLENGNLVFSKNNDYDVLIVNNQRGESIISLGEHTNTNISINDELFINPITAINGEEINLLIEVNEGYFINKVLINDNEELIEVDGYYSFILNGNTEIKVIATDSVVNIGSLAKYIIEYDLGSRKTAKIIDSSEELLNSFKLIEGNENFIQSINSFVNIYGGGNGGRGDTAWLSGDMLKFGTTSVTGDLTLELNSLVNQVKITGYVHATNARIQLGDSNSTDWTDGVADNKTNVILGTSMNVVSKEAIDNYDVITVVIDIADTNSFKLATIRNVALYLTEIEFIYNYNDNN